MQVLITFTHSVKFAEPFTCEKSGCFDVHSAASRGQSSRHHSRAGGAASVQVAAVGGAWREGGVVWDERQR